MTLLVEKIATNTDLINLIIFYFVHEIFEIYIMFQFTILLVWYLLGHGGAM